MRSYLENIMNMAPTLTGVTVEQDAQTITCTWSDGFRFAFPMDGLRRACPCVMCKGGHEHMGAPVDLDVFRGTPLKRRTVRGAQPMGGYALQFTWEDGHNSGLYRLDQLRAWAEALSGRS